MVSLAPTTAPTAMRTFAPFDVLRALPTEDIVALVRHLREIPFEQSAYFSTQARLLEASPSEDGTAGQISNIEGLKILSPSEAPYTAVDMMRRAGVVLCAGSKFPNTHAAATTQDIETLTMLTAAAGYNLYYGGSDFGFMGIGKDGFYKGRDQKSYPHHYCVQTTPVSFADPTFVSKNGKKASNEGLYNGTDYLVLTSAGLSNRLRFMDGHAVARLVVCGSFGTQHELAEALVKNKTGLTEDPIIILNTKGYFTPLLTNFFVDKIYKYGMEKASGNSINQKLFHVIERPEQILQILEDFKKTASTAYQERASYKARCAKLDTAFTPVYRSNQKIGYKLAS